MAKEQEPPKRQIVKARWVAGFRATHNGEELIPGKSIAEIPVEEAEASDDWEIVKEKAGDK